MRKGVGTRSGLLALGLTLGFFSSCTDDTGASPTTKRDVGEVEVVSDRQLLIL